ncbi:MAG: hypothetical protein ACE5NG_19475 [bacterium]
MEVSEIRKQFEIRPFKPLEIHLDNGDKYVVTHPEIIITDSIVVAVDEDGEAIYIAPEAISAIKLAEDKSK